MLIAAGESANRRDRARARTWDSVIELARREGAVERRPRANSSASTFVAIDPATRPLAHGRHAAGRSSDRSHGTFRVEGRRGDLDDLEVRAPLFSRLRHRRCRGWRAGPSTFALMPELLGGDARASGFRFSSRKPWDGARVPPRPRKRSCGRASNARSRSGSRGAGHRPSRWKRGGGRNPSKTAVRGPIAGTEIGRGLGGLSGPLNSPTAPVPRRELHRLERRSAHMGSQWAWRAARRGRRPGNSGVRGSRRAICRVRSVSSIGVASSTSLDLRTVASACGA